MLGENLLWNFKIRALIICHKLISYLKICTFSVCVCVCVCVYICGLKSNFSTQQRYILIDWLIDLTALDLSCGTWDLCCVMRDFSLGYTDSLGTRTQWLWSTGLVASWMWGLSSPTSDWTHVACIARWILNHWISREIPILLYWSSTTGEIRV